MRTQKFRLDTKEYLQKNWHIIETWFSLSGTERFAVKLNFGSGFVRNSVLLQIATTSFL